MAQSLGDVGTLTHYLAAFHWMIVHLGAGEVYYGQATNSWEFLASILAVLIGVVLFSTMVSSATNSLAQIQQNHADHLRQLSMVHRLGRQHHIPRELFKRITRFIRTEISELTRKRVDYNQIDILGMLSRPLYEELVYYIHVQDFQVHQLFEQTMTRNPSLLHGLIRILESLYLGTGDYLFHERAEAESIFFGSAGQFIYESSLYDEDLLLGQGRWFSEPVLWAKWFYEGSLQSKTPSRLTTIKALQFVDVIKDTPAAWTDYAKYSEDYLENLLNQREEIPFDIHMAFPSKQVADDDDSIDSG
jgi:hypothetical protein